MIRFARKGIRASRTTIVVKGKRVRLLILKPMEPVEQATGVLWIHGGGYATGMKEMAYFGRAADLVREHGAVVIAPGYHLSALHPYPTAVEECYAALLYLKEQGMSLGINTNQLMVGGESAGGGLTAAVCMMARDRGEVNVAFQMPLYPMLDNFDTDTSRDNHARVWNTRRNHMAWRMYLREDYQKEVSPYAAPARQRDYTNLPPAYTFVCTAEPFYRETLDYVENLKNAGVEAVVDVYEGMYHSFDLWQPDHPVGQEAIRRFNDYFAFAQKRYYAANTTKKEEDLP